MGMIIQNGKIFSGDVILKGATIDTLWSGTGSTVGGTVALSNPYTDYDLLVFKCQNANGSMYDSSTWETKSIALSTQLQISNLTVSSTARRTIISFTNSTTITLSNLDGNNYLKEVIGIKLNGGVADYHEYSTSEKVVGKWIDGSTLYEKTYAITSAISIGTSWSDTGFVLPANTNRIIGGFIYRNAQNGALMYCAFSIGSSNHLNAMLSIADNLDVGSSITIRYTKAS